MQKENTMNEDKVSNAIVIHNTLWECYDERINQDLKINNKFYRVRYQANTRSRCARVEIDGTVWESQNMIKASPNTDLIKSNPSIRISWAFYHSGTSIEWLDKVQSEDTKDGRNIQHYNLRTQPNELVEEVYVPFIKDEDRELWKDGPFGKKIDWYCIHRPYVPLTRKTV